MAVAPVHFGAKIGLRHIHAGMETTDGIDHVDAIAADRRRIDHCGELGSGAHIGTKPDFFGRTLRRVNHGFVAVDGPTRGSEAQLKSRFLRFWTSIAE